MKLAEQLENYAITQEMADEARECKAEFKRLDAHIVELEVATWAAWNELNAIRARDGVPWTHQRMKSDIDETYFSQVVDALSDALGDDAKPWPAKRWLEQDGTLPFVK